MSPPSLCSLIPRETLHVSCQTTLPGKNIPLLQLWQRLGGEVSLREKPELANNSVLRAEIHSYFNIKKPG